MRGNIFIKIFFGFWLASIAVLGSWMLTNEYFESRAPVHRAGHKPPAGPPHRFVLRTIYELQNVGDEQLAVLVDRARDDHGVEIYLLNREEEVILGKEPTEEVLAIARKLESSKRRRAFHNTPQGGLLAHNIYRPEHGPLRAVFAFGAPEHPWLGILGGNPWLRLTVAMLVSGLICYGLSHLLTRRLKLLRKASNRLAKGELETRLNVRESGGDETDELARGFNTMAAQLQERIEAQKRLLSDVSHELRSPLARLRVALALAQESNQKSEQNLQRIEQETERLEELISQLLSSRGENLTLDCHIDLVGLLEQLREDANFEGRQQGKTVEFTHQMTEAVIPSSGDLLHKSFDNVLRNALRHTPDGSKVRVSLKAEDGCYLLEIQDSGPGIPEQELKNIFAEFYRVDHARSREQGGYGLGLAIACRAIERHGGSIKASNNSEGLVVSILLPA